MTEEIEEPQGGWPQRARVLVDDAEVTATFTKMAVMFEKKDGTTWGFDRSTVRSVKLLPKVPAWMIAYSIGGEIRAMKVKVIEWENPKALQLTLPQWDPERLTGVCECLREFVSQDDVDLANELLLDQDRRRREGPGAVQRAKIPD